MYENKLTFFVVNLNEWRIKTFVCVLPIDPKCRKCTLPTPWGGQEGTQNKPQCLFSFLPLELSKPAAGSLPSHCWVSASHRTAREHWGTGCRLLPQGQLHYTHVIPYKYFSNLILEASRKAGATMLFPSALTIIIFTKFSLVFYPDFLHCNLCPFFPAHFDARSIVSLSSLTMKQWQTKPFYLGIFCTANHHHKICVMRTTTRTSRTKAAKQTISSKNEVVWTFKELQSLAISS